MKITKQNVAYQSMTFLKALLAGLLIGVAAWLYLSVDNKYIGGALFSLALILICFIDLRLFTSKNGYLVDEGNFYFVDVLVILLGNIIGCLLVAFTISTINNPDTMTKALDVYNHKTALPWYAKLLSAVFCGVLMHIAGYCYKKIENKLVVLVILAFIVMTFLLTGMEHSIANVVFYTLGGWNWTVLGYFAIVVSGNMIGSAIIELLLNVITYKGYKRLPSVH